MLADSGTRGYDSVSSGGSVVDHVSVVARSSSSSDRPEPGGSGRSEPPHGSSTRAGSAASPHDGSAVQRYHPAGEARRSIRSAGTEYQHSPMSRARQRHRRADAACRGDGGSESRLGMVLLSLRRTRDGTTRGPANALPRFQARPVVSTCPPLVDKIAMDEYRQLQKFAKTWKYAAALAVLLPHRPIAAIVRSVVPARTEMPMLSLAVSPIAPPRDDLRCAR